MSSLNRSTSEVLERMKIHFSMEKEIKSLDDIEIQEYEVPAPLREDHFDMVLIYAEKDQTLALLFRDILQKHIKLQDNRHVRVCVIDRSELDWISNKFKHIEEAVKRSTYMFLFMSRNFVNDSWAELQGDECLQESIERPERRWCVIPIHTVPKRRCDYSTPFGLRALKGVHVDKVFADPSATFNCSKSIDQIEFSDLDPFFIKQMQNLFNARLREKISREEKQKQMRTKWEKKERVRRYKVYQEEKKRQALEEAEHQRQMELLQQQAAEETARGREEIAAKTLNDLPLPPTEPVPDFVPATEVRSKPVYCNYTYSECVYATVPKATGVLIVNKYASNYTHVHVPCHVHVWCDKCKCRCKLFNLACRVATFRASTTHTFTSTSTTVRRPSTSIWYRLSTVLCVMKCYC